MLKPYTSEPQWIWDLLASQASARLAELDNEQGDLMWYYCNACWYEVNVNIESKLVE